MYLGTTSISMVATSRGKVLSFGNPSKKKEALKDQYDDVLHELNQLRELLDDLQKRIEYMVLLPTLLQKSLSWKNHWQRRGKELVEVQ